MMSRSTLQARIRAYMDGSLVGQAPEAFDTLARAVHTWQAEQAPHLAAMSPPMVRSWHDLPAVPVDLYKRLRIGTVLDDPAPVTFLTSGTTGGGRGVHALRDTVLYDHGALAWWRRCVPDAPADVVALLDDAILAPDSSLSHMVGLFGSAAHPVSWHVVSGALDVEGLELRVRAAQAPLFVCATAFALAMWLERQPSRLPHGSVVMVTGGFKGRTVELDDAQLYAAVRERLACRRVVVEYGMTELSSQLWGADGTALAPPPWLRAVAVDPATGEPRAAGEVGQLRFYDLANLDSSIGVETLDRGRVHADGAVELLGRLDGAEARGCSLRIEEAWDRRVDA